MAAVRSTEKELISWRNKMEELYQNKMCVNHMLHVNGEEYPCNAAVLYAAPLPPIPAEQWEETFRKIRPPLIAPLLRYMYCCEIAVTMNTLKDIMLASKILQLSHLQDACEQFLKQQLCPENYLGWYRFTVKKNFEASATYCKERIYRELNKVRQCTEFHELSLADVSDVINDKRDGEDGSRSDTRFHAVMSWLLVDESRYVHAETLLDMIELSKCSKQCLKLATEEPYSTVLWSVTLQNKLLRACLQSVSSGDILVERYVPTDASASCVHLLGREMQPNADFEVSMFNRFGEFYANNLNTDIRLQASSDTIDAHQIVLATKSPYFEAVIRSADKTQNEDSALMAEMPSPMISDLSHLDSNALKTAVDFMYTGSADIKDADLLKMIETCDFLQLNKLMETCKEQTKAGPTMSDENCYDWLKAGRLFSLSDIQSRAVKFVCENFERVRHKNDLETLERDDMLMILDNALLPSIDEQSVYEAIIAWIMHSPDTRRSCLSAFLDTYAMKRCQVNSSIDMKALLQNTDFDMAEKEHVWKAHYNKLQEQWSNAKKCYEDSARKAAAENETLKQMYAVKLDTAEKKVVESARKAAKDISVAQRTAAYDIETAKRKAASDIAAKIKQNQELALQIQSLQTNKLVREQEIVQQRDGRRGDRGDDRRSRRGPPPQIAGFTNTYN